MSDYIIVTSFSPLIFLFSIVKLLFDASNYFLVRNLINFTSGSFIGDNDYVPTDLSKLVLRENYGEC